MKISEFIKSLDEFLSEFFGCKIRTDVNFGDGGFVINSYLVLPEERLVYQDEVQLYQVGLVVDETASLIVMELEIPFIRESFLLNGIKKNYTPEEALVYIKERLTSPKSKAIYENL